MKAHPRQLRLEPDIDREVHKIAELTGLPQTEVIRQMVTAGARAIAENNYKLPLPLTLRIVPDAAAASSVYPPHRDQILRAEDKPSSGQGREVIQKAVMREEERLRRPRPKSP